MTTVLGILGILLFIVGVISLSAATTWLVVKISPAKHKKKPAPVEG
jgi:hypothetical protein